MRKGKRHQRQAPKERGQPRSGTVTATSVQVRDSNRISIFVDEKFSFGMPVLAAMELGITKGTELDEALLARCLSEEEFYRSRQRALGLIAHRSRSSSELRGRLRQAGFGQPAVEAAVQKMTELGYLNDASFAESFARNRILTRQFGTRRVLTELRLKGIGDVQAQQVVSELNADRDEAADAREHAERHVSRQPASLAPRKRRERLYAYLARRGFGPDIIRPLLQELLS